MLVIACIPVALSVVSRWLSSGGCASLWQSALSVGSSVVTDHFRGGRWRAMVVGSLRAGTPPCLSLASSFPCVVKMCFGSVPLWLVGCRCSLHFFGKPIAEWLSEQPSGGVQVLLGLLSAFWFAVLNLLVCSSWPPSLQHRILFFFLPNFFCWSASWKLVKSFCSGH